MTVKITLELPERVIEQARAEAVRRGNPVENILTEWLEAAASQELESLSQGTHHVYTPLDSEATAHDLQKILEDYQAGNANADKIHL